MGYQEFLLQLYCMHILTYGINEAFNNVEYILHAEQSCVYKFMY